MQFYLSLRSEPSIEQCLNSLVVEPAHLSVTCGPKEIIHSFLDSGESPLNVLRTLARVSVPSLSWSSVLRTTHLSVFFELVGRLENNDWPWSCSIDESLQLFPVLKDLLFVEKTQTLQNQSLAWVGLSADSAAGLICLSHVAERLAN